MNKTSICFIITLISGLSTMVGSLIIFNRFKNKSRVITFCLLFSSFVMLYLSLFDLIPASFMYINKIYDFGRKSKSFLRKRFRDYVQICHSEIVHYC